MLLSCCHFVQLLGVVIESNGPRRRPPRFFFLMKLTHKCPSQYFPGGPLRQASSSPQRVPSTLRQHELGVQDHQAHPGQGDGHQRLPEAAAQGTHRADAVCGAVRYGEERSGEEGVEGTGIYFKDK